jgi:hypothetical protein
MAEVQTAQLRELQGRQLQRQEERLYALSIILHCIGPSSAEAPPLARLANSSKCHHNTRMLPQPELQLAPMFTVFETYAYICWHQCCSCCPCTAHQGAAGTALLQWHVLQDAGHHCLWELRGLHAWS